MKRLVKFLRTGKLVLSSCYTSQLRLIRLGLHTANAVTEEKKLFFLEIPQSVLAPFTTSN